MHCAQPWQMRPQRSGTGSAFIVDIEKKRIMTNAHVVCSYSVGRILYKLSNSRIGLWLTYPALLPSEYLWPGHCRPHVQ